MKPAIKYFSYFKRYNIAYIIKTIIVSDDPLVDT